MPAEQQLYPVVIFYSQYKWGVISTKIFYLRNKFRADVDRIHKLFKYD